MLGHASPEMLCSVYARFMRACARRTSIKPGARSGNMVPKGGFVRIHSAEILNGDHLTKGYKDFGRFAK